MSELYVGFLFFDWMCVQGYIYSDQPATPSVQDLGNIYLMSLPITVTLGSVNVF